MKEIELIEKRKPREKHFLQEDGTIVAKVYSEDIHFKKNGKYEEIDNTLIKIDGEYCNKNNDYKVKFKEESKTSLMRLEKDGNYLNIDIKNCNCSKIKIKDKCSKLEQEVKYSNILDDISIEYKTLPTKIKETIILKNSNHTKIDFIVKTNMDLIVEDNCIVAKNNENTIFTIEPPYMEDSAGKINNNIYYHVKKHTDHYDMELVLDEEWLNSLDVQYPVYVDPTITNTNQASGLYDTYIYPGDENTDRNSQGILKAGTERVNGIDRINRTLIKFDLPEIGTGSEIIASSINLIAYPTLKSPNDDKTMSIHRVTKDWNDSTATWNDMHDKYDDRIEGILYGNRSTVIDNSVVPVYLESTDITSLVKKWYEDTPNRGILIKSCLEEYQDDNFPAFYSTNNSASGEFNPKPIFSLSYRNQNGIENYLNYKNQSFGIGKTYVNTYNGNMTGLFELANTVDSVLPVCVNLVYNTNDVVLNKDTIFGKGYKINFNQTIKTTAISNNEYLEYNDENGTLHYFSKPSTEAEEIYYDEDGLEMTIAKDNINCIITDKDNNKLTFTNYNGIYYLTKISDFDNNSIIIQLNNDNRISKIIDRNNSEIGFDYQGNKIIVSSINGSTNLIYNNGKLSKIEKTIGNTYFNYNESSLISSIEDINGMKICYEYYSKAPYKMKKVLQYGLNNVEGQSFILEYSINSTNIMNSNGTRDILIFNSYGNLLSSNSMPLNLDLNKAYSTSQSIGMGDSTKNKLLSKMIPIKYIKNYLKNSSFEQDYDNFICSSQVIKTFYTDDYVSGNRSLKIDSTDVNQFIEQSINLLKGKYYTFSGYFKTNDDVELILSYTNNNEEEVSCIQTITKSNDFIRDDITIFYDIDSTSDLKIKINMPKNGTLIVDDIQLEEGKVANEYNIIENSDFSDGFADWICTSWTYGELSTPPKNFVESVKVNNELNSALKVRMSPLYGTKISKVLPIKGQKGDRYTISFWYKNEGYNSNGPLIGNNVGIYFKPVGHDADYCTIPSSSFNANDKTWQYFTFSYSAIEDYESVTLDFIQGREANNLYITNLSFYKDVTFGEYKYDDKGNLVSLNNQSNTKSTYKYDSNNKLVSAISPNDKNYLYEYDNEKESRLLTTISSDGMCNEFEYDSFGNIVSTKISKKQISNIENGIYLIRSKGTKKYLKAELNSILLEANQCSNSLWYIEKNDEHYKFKYNVIQSYTIVDDIDKVSLSNNINCNNLFCLEKNENGSYLISVKKEHEAKRYLKANDNQLILTDSVEKDASFEFYIELPNKLFFEEKTTYSSDGRFVESITDINLKTTEYETDPVSGFVTSVMDANNNTTTYNYNDKKQLTLITTGDKETSYVYDSHNLLSKISKEGRDYNITYDDFFNVTSIKLGDSVILLENEYAEKNGNLIKTKFGNNQFHAYDYDEFNRINLLYKDNDAYYFDYDNHGNMAKISSSSSSYKYLYDIANRLYKYSFNNFKIQYVYDSDNNISGKEYKLNNNNYDIEYNSNKDGIIINSNFLGNNIYYQRDSLNRLMQKKINNDFNSNYSYISYGNKATTLVKSEIHGNDKYSYKYDKLNNITDIYNNDILEKHYVYNQYQELISDDDYVLLIHNDYEYDLFGNLMKKISKNINTNDIIKINTYSYENINWKDQLTKYNDSNIIYDGAGNIIKFGNNIDMNWKNGHELSSYVDSSKDLSVNYEYGIDGIRTRKTINTNEITYYYEGGNLILEKQNNNVIYYIRDSEGLIGFSYNDLLYYYIKNIQGDIIGILDNNYNKIVEYKYDCWGKVLEVIDNSSNGIGLINPMRYRSYYYDTDTEMYYLNSRYYNPETRRFISADTNLGSNDDQNGYNLYAYVSNNPVNNSDPSGESLKSWFKKKVKQVKKIVKKATKVIKKVVKAVCNFGSTVMKTLQKASTAVNKSFVLEAKVGFGFGGTKKGIIDARAEASKTVGFTIENEKFYQFTNNTAGFEVGKEDTIGTLGLSADIKHNDNGYENPMALPWQDEIWNDKENTTKDFVVGYKCDKWGTSEKDPDKDYMFIGLDFSGFIGIGGGIKIGFNIPSN